MDLFRAKSITQFERSNLFVGYILFGSCRIACKDRVEERRAGKISCIDTLLLSNKLEITSYHKSIIYHSLHFLLSSENLDNLHSE